MSKTRTSPWLILRQAQDERCNFKWLKKFEKSLLWLLLGVLTLHYYISLTRGIFPELLRHRIKILLSG
ncbi:MAG: hypothetical protein AAB091_04670 [Elusimicrobiota bacterium]